MQKYMLISLTLFLTVAGQLIIKWRAVSTAELGASASKLVYIHLMLTDPYVWCGLAGAVVASICWMLALQQAALSIAYPFMALSFMLVPTAAALLFNETISSGQYIGQALIVAGVTLTAIWR
jgi:drug/metabolite transporter (DMT)-like permease